MNAEKRYQIFISSTFRDLVDERQAVLKAILELDHMPSGMELFPASDDTAWNLIKDVIDASDYYVIILGGRYGSLDSDGIGYTEKEYDYAVQKKKSVVPLLHGDPDNLPRGRTETDAEAWEKLTEFRAKVEDRHTCAYWTSVEELKAKVIVGLTSTIKRAPAIGWVRADRVPDDSTLADVLSLRNQISELQTQVEKTKTDPPAGAEDLFQGDDTFKLDVKFSSRVPGNHFESQSWTASIEPSWNEIFGGVAPSMISEVSDLDLRKAFKALFTRIAHEDFDDSDGVKGMDLINFKFRDDQIDTCIVQMRALGLISESDRRRSVRDTATYWTLTPYGDHAMVQLRALRKEKTKRRRRLAPAQDADADADAK